jgi:ABC-type nitrate/sulfonate/bicarbonate transport system substrate-binding protein
MKRSLTFALAAGLAATMVGTSVIQSAPANAATTTSIGQSANVAPANQMAAMKKKKMKKKGMKMKMKR